MSASLRGAHACARLAGSVNAWMPRDFTACPIAPSNGRYSIAVLDTKDGKITVPVHFKDENINSVFWKGNDRLLFNSAIDGHEIPAILGALAELVIGAVADREP